LLKRAFLFAVVLFAALQLSPRFRTVRGIVPRSATSPVSGIQVVLKAKTSELTLDARTDDAGQFHFDSVPIGEYNISINVLTSWRCSKRRGAFRYCADFAFELRLPAQNETVVVSADAAQTETVTPTSLVDACKFRNARRFATNVSR